MPKLISLQLIVVVIIAVNITEIRAKNNEKDNDSHYQKTISIGIDPLSTLAAGPAFFAEYSALKGFSVTAGFQIAVPAGLAVQYIEDEYDLEVSGYSVNSGFRYYFNYRDRGLDSFYAGAGYAYSSIAFEEDKDPDTGLDMSIHSIVFLTGKRWQWDTFFLDLNGYLSYSLVKTESDKNFDNEDAETFRKGFKGFTPGVQLIAGAAF